ncbi:MULTISPECIES: hypothetical protein [unclassified Rhodococcus (in: high G+C Gram-positive bacteria)]|uniref:hypothetical protein n=1 Tax=unclassified Rhodococcus (in: high G+C Gram-positive bacteria) TaxID=192944 RepID=UPI001140281D|nr:MULTISPECIES: hypothetical protein [unclassified Rhodococcus (in: high G+C Gram-positive bacteria)]
MNPVSKPPVCELPQGMVGTPRCTKAAEHVANIHGCILDQPEHEWIRVRVCVDHIIAGHKAWTAMAAQSVSGRAVCAGCGKPFPRFRELFRKVRP